jgi:hypothetical protein
VRGADAVIRRALEITPQELDEDLAVRYERVLGEIAADMADVVPCTEEAFREEFVRRYELNVDRDEDARTITKVLGRILRYEDEKHDAPFLVTFPSWPRLDVTEVRPTKKDPQPSC